MLESHHVSAVLFFSQRAKAYAQVSLDKHESRKSRFLSWVSDTLTFTFHFLHVCETGGGGNGTRRCFYPRLIYRFIAILKKWKAMGGKKHALSQTNDLVWLLRYFMDPPMFQLYGESSLPWVLSPSTCTCCCWSLSHRSATTHWPALLLTTYTHNRRIDATQCSPTPCAPYPGKSMEDFGLVTFAPGHTRQSDLMLLSRDSRKIPTSELSWDG